MPIRIDAGKCAGCRECIRVCVPEALSIVDGVISVDGDKCVQCGACAQVCPNKALELVLEAAPVHRSPEVLELQARSIARPSSDLPATRNSGEWLSLLGRAAVGVVTFLLDRAASGDTPTSARRGAGGRCPGRMRRRGGRRCR